MRDRMNIHDTLNPFDLQNIVDSAEIEHGEMSVMECPVLMRVMEMVSALNSFCLAHGRFNFNTK